MQPEVRRNAVTAVGVTLAEAPDVPSRGEVQFCFPSGQRCIMRWRVALGDIHPSGDIQSLHAPGSWPGRITHVASAWTRASADARASMDMTDCMTAALAKQGGRKSGSHAPVTDHWPPYGEAASWKDPL
jgi:hypothetical protein